MGKLFLFGCSYTAEYSFDLGLNHAYSDYYKFRGGNFPPTWGQVLASKLNLDLVNYGKGGNGNDQIFQDICKHSSEFKSGDIVIIEWSYIARFRMAHFEGNKWCNFGPVDNSYEIIDKDTVNNILVNRTHELYIEQIYDFQNIIESLSKALGFRLYFWSADYQIIYPNEKINKQTKYIGNEYIKKEETIFNEVFRRNGQRLLEETNGLIKDLHFGESGHRILGEIFYSHIKGKLI
jgi:hypothetical protein